MQNTGAGIWDDLEAPWEPGVDAPAMIEPRVWEEPCDKCRGAGMFRSYSGRVVGKCFVCKGAGKRTFRSAPDQRLKSRASAQKAKARKQEALAQAAQAWREANPLEAAWLLESAPRFGFAASMVEALDKYGSLTERQMETVQRLAEQSRIKEAAWAAEKASAPEVSIEPIIASFQAAKAAGIKVPRLRLADFVFSPAPMTGANAGAIYVKRGDEYLGKIAQGRFMKVRSCEAVTEADVIQVASNPREGAVAYGRRYGKCGCCGRELTNKASIDLGIGPICAEKFGW